MKKSNYLLLLTAVIFFSFSFIKFSDHDITTKDIINNIKYLASDDLGGRFPGTQGDTEAENFIINKFKEYGLKEAGTNGYKQPFDFVSEVKLADNNKLTIIRNGNATNYEVKSDYTPVGISSIGTAEGDLVFAGYAITATDQNYNDLANVDVKDKIAVILRYSPGYTDPHDNPFSMYESTRLKVENLIAAGAKGIMIATGPNSEAEDELMRLRVDNSTLQNKVPVISIKRAILEELFNSDGKDLKTVQEAIDKNKTPNSFALNSKATIQTDFFNVRAYTANIIGMIEGSDPVLKNEYIVIGAHMDHLGDGLKYGSLYTGNDAAIHNGADDNASGTSGVLELAEKMAEIQSDDNKFKRSYLFMLFGAEEAGLIGSAYFTNSSLFDKYKVAAMINMDMIGRLTNNKLIVNGTGTSSQWKPLLESINKDFNFDLSLQSEGFGSSDYSSFYSKDVPVLGFFTGLHSDYHKPSDDWDKINAAGEKQILDFVYNTLVSIDKSAKPDFVKTKVDNNQQNMTGFRVTMGVVPDYGSTDEGMKIVGVRAGGPAEKAGLAANDVIVKMGDTDIKNVYDYTFALGKFKPGDETEVVVKRGTETITFKVVFNK